MRFLPVFACLLLFLQACSPFGRHPAPAPKVIFLAVDGLGSRVFERCRKDLGLFTNFKSTAVHIAPFPSITDHVWSLLLRPAELFGSTARLRYYEAVHFDVSTASVSGDIRYYYQRLAGPDRYHAGFRNFLIPFVEGFLYFSDDEPVRLELETVKAGLEADLAEPFSTAFIGSVDSVSHTSRNGLYRTLARLDAMIREVQSYYADRGVPLEILMVSDHGMGSGFTEGEPEIPLLPVDLGPSFGAMGFHLTNALSGPRDVSVPVLALANYMSVYLKDRSRTDRLMAAMSEQPWFDLAAAVLSRDGGTTRIRVVTRSGTGIVGYRKPDRKYFYLPEAGNPLGLPPESCSVPDRQVLLDENEIFSLTSNSSRPDSIYRLARAADNPNAEFPDILVSMDERYFVRGPLSRFVTMYRTHGAIGRDTSSGIVASTRPDRGMPACVRTSDVLATVGLKPSDFFDTARTGFRSDPRRTAREIRRKTYQGCRTMREDLSQSMLFHRAVKALTCTRFVLDEKTLAGLSGLAGLRNGPIEGIHSLDQVLTPAELGRLIDMALRLRDPDRIKESPEYKSIVAGRLGGMFPGTGTGFRPLKLAFTRSYTMPFLLDRMLDFPETDFLADDRNPVFALQWRKVRKNPPRRTIPGLFSEVFKERRLAGRVSPAPMDLLYPGLPRGITFVFVPGIYDRIFDGEIFASGLDSLREDLGLEVIRAPVDSSASSEVNAAVLMEYLKTYSRNRTERGFPAPKFFVLGYSKGCIDSLHAFLRDPGFVAANVLGLAAIAAPLGGSAVLEKADLPYDVLSLLSSDPVPEADREKDKASRSIRISAMRRFWRQNAPDLAGLTRYYSVSFVSELGDAHPWMRLTKLIAGFAEKNDGVVALSASKFPDALRATDLGTVTADHLAGVAANRFPQDAFLQALVITLDRLSAFAPKRPFSRSRTTSGNREKWRTLPVSDRPPFKLPRSTLGFDLDRRIAIDRITAVLSANRIDPIDPGSRPEGFSVIYDHRQAEDFREEYGFNYESRSPSGCDDNPVAGVSSVLLGGKGAESIVARLASSKNSIRLTTAALRFRPADFPRLRLKIRVDREVEGADIRKGRSRTCRADSAFKVWFTFRSLAPGGDPRTVPPGSPVFVLGYYWGNDSLAGKGVEPGSIDEDWYSRRIVMGIFRVPEMHDVLLASGRRNLGRLLEFDEDLAADIRRAYPGLDPDSVQVIAVTLQMDSNDMKSSSLAYFKSLQLLPGRGR